MRIKFDTFMRQKGKVARFVDARCKRFGCTFELCYLVAVQWE